MVMARTQQNQPNHTSMFQVTAYMTTACTLLAKASYMAGPKVNETMVNGRHCESHGKGCRCIILFNGGSENWNNNSTHIISTPLSLSLY